MKKVLNGVKYILVYGIQYLLLLLPMRLFYILSGLLYLIMAYISRYRHHVVWKNPFSSLSGRSHKELMETEKNFYYWPCNYLVETIELMIINAPEVRRRMKFTGLEQFNKALSSGQSCAIYLGHYGNWEWITPLPNQSLYQMQCCQLYHPLENKRLDWLPKRIRERHKALYIPIHNLLRKILEFKRNNQAIAVGYIADQIPL